MKRGSMLGTILMPHRHTRLLQRSIMMLKQMLKHDRRGGERKQAAVRGSTPKAKAKSRGSRPETGAAKSAAAKAPGRRRNNCRPSQNEREAARHRQDHNATLRAQEQCRRLEAQLAESEAALWAAELANEFVVRRNAEVEQKNTELHERAERLLRDVSREMQIPLTWEASPSPLGASAPPMLYHTGARRERPGGPHGKIPSDAQQRWKATEYSKPCLLLRTWEAQAN